MNLRRYDLNLLVVLDVLLAERSATAAARRLNLTQPAVSQALARAREVFGDPLLVRDGAGMVPTKFAHNLAPRLAQALAEVGRVLTPPTFDPATAVRDFVISGGDLAELAILPPMIARAAVAAPGCRMILRSVEAQPADAGIDLSVMGTDPPDGPFRQRQLGQERFVLLARHGHPALDRGLTAEAFAALPQALVSPRGTGMVGPVDTALAALGLRRQVRLSVTRFTTLPTILAATDLIAAVPASFADRPEVRAVCGQRSLPFASPVLTWRLVWHVVHDADPGNRWLRGLA